jgi:hypothetical protein
MPTVKQLAARLVAVFIASATANIGVGAIMNVNAGKAAVMAGGVAVLGVVQKLAMAYRDTGTITDDDLDDAVEAGDK